MTRTHLSDLLGRVLPSAFPGSYPRPGWFNENLFGRDIVSALRRDEAYAEAYKDAMRAMIGDQEDAGLDLLADGHLWYDKHQGFMASFVLYNLERMEGVEITPTWEKQRVRRGVVEEDNEMALRAVEEDTRGEIGNVAEALFTSRIEVVGPLRSAGMHHAVNWSLAQQCTDRPVKAQFADGPVGLSTIPTNRHYKDRRAMLRDLADIFNAEMREAVAAGARFVQLDDLFFNAPRDEWSFDVEIFNRVFDGVDAYKILHVCHGGTPGPPVGHAPYPELFPYFAEINVDCFELAFAQTGFRDDHLALLATPGFDKDVGVGAVSNKNYVIETPREVADGLLKACRYIEPERVHASSDCGLFAYTRATAKAKLKSLARGAALARAELGYDDTIGAEPAALGSE
jgi:methionine synthase II (cobalamin-independent)